MDLIDKPDWWEDYKGYIEEYLPERRLELDKKLEYLHLKCRELACNYIEEKIKRFFAENKIKYISVVFEEYSNLSPFIEIKLPYKGEIYDRFYVFFNRDNYYKNLIIWLPTQDNYHSCYSATHKKNDDIIKKLAEFLSVDEIKKTVNFPFICPHRSIT